MEDAKEVREQTSDSIITVRDTRIKTHASSMAFNNTFLFKMPAPSIHSREDELSFRVKCDLTVFHGPPGPPILLPDRDLTSSLVPEMAQRKTVPLVDAIYSSLFCQLQVI